MKRLLFTVCCAAVFATNSFTQNITAGSQNEVTQFIPKSFDDNFCLIQTNCITLKEANKTAEEIHKMGGRIAVIGSPQFMIGWLPEGVREIVTSAKNIKAVYAGRYNVK